MVPTLLLRSLLSVHGRVLLKELLLEFTFFTEPENSLPYSRERDIARCLEFHTRHLRRML